MAGEAQQIETVEQAYGKDAKAIVQRWKAEIELYEEEYADYHERCRRILERYRDERATDGARKVPRFNVLWSNNNVIEPATYAQRPKIEASRRFHDRDPIGRLSCEIIERAVSVGLDDDRYDFDGVMARARQDFCLLARGVVWERYEPVFVSGQVTDDKTKTEHDEQPESKLVWEHTCTEHLHYEDFGHTSGARAWEEVSAVWRKAYMTREELEKRFTIKLKNGNTVGHAVPLDYCPKRITSKGEETSKYSHFKKATVYEIWDRASGKVYWISKEYPDSPLDMKEDTLGLRGFFPCPKPAYGTLTNDSLVPIPDYVQIQDLCNELDMLTARITLITNAIQAKGVYEKSLATTGLANLLKGAELDMIPVDLAKFTGVANGGDLKRLIMYAPNEMLVAVLNVLYDARERTKALIYEVSGNSDIMRGATDPRETATAQQGKMTFGNLRLESKQKEFARFARDILRIKAEITCEKFQPETLAAMVGFDPEKSQQDLTIPQIPAGPPMMGPDGQQQPPQMLPPEAVFGQAIELMRNDTLRAYRIDIETDSTIALDEQQEKADATELVVNIGQYFQNAMPIVQAMPSFGPVAKELLMFIIRRYKAGRSMEESIEQALDESINAAQQAQQNQGGQDPAMAKVQQDGQLKAQQMQMQGQAQQMAEQGKMAIEQERLKLQAAELQQKGMLTGAELQLKRDIAEADNRRKIFESQANMQIKQQQMVADLMGAEEQRRQDTVMRAAEFGASEEERMHRQKMAERQPKAPR